MIMIFFTLFPIVAVCVIEIIFYIVDSTEYCYKTKYSLDLCLDYMKHDNVYDLYDYTWEEVNGRYFISLDKLKTELSPMPLRPSFEVMFKRVEKETEIRIIYIKKIMAPTPAIGTKYIDLFWKKKLNADKI